MARAPGNGLVRPTLNGAKQADLSQSQQHVYLLAQRVFLVRSANISASAEHGYTEQTMD